MFRFQERLKERAETLFQIREPGSAPARWGLRVGKLLYLTLRGFTRDLCSERAAGLAFTTLVAFIPLAILLLFLFGSLTDFGDVVNDFRDRLVDTIIASSGEEGGAGAESGDDVRAAQRIRDSLDDLKDELEKPLKEGLGLVKLAAVLVLLWMVLSLFRSAERTFSVIWNVDNPRSFMKKLAVFWMLLTATPLILILAKVVQQNLGEGVGGVGQTLFGACISFFAFTLIFATLPSARVKLGPATVAALVCAVIWELGSRAFVIYMKYAVLANVYATIGAIPFLLVFVYLAWANTLLGAELCYCIQNYELLDREVRFHLSGERVRPAVLSLFVLERVYMGFDGSRSPATAAAAAQEFQVPLGPTEEIVSTLVEGGFVVCGEGGVLTPARSAESVTYQQIFDLFPTGHGFLIEELELPESPLREEMLELSRDLSKTFENRQFGSPVTSGP